MNINLNIVKILCEHKHIDIQLSIEASYGKGQPEDLDPEALEEFFLQVLNFDPSRGVAYPFSLSTYLTTFESNNKTGGTYVYLGAEKPTGECFYVILNRTTEKITAEQNELQKRMGRIKNDLFVRFNSVIDKIFPDAGREPLPDIAVRLFEIADRIDFQPTNRHFKTTVTDISLCYALQTEFNELPEENVENSIIFISNYLLKLTEYLVQLGQNFLIHLARRSHLHFDIDKQGKKFYLRYRSKTANKDNLHAMKFYPCPPVVDFFSRLFTLCESDLMLQRLYCIVLSSYSRFDIESRCQFQQLIAWDRLADEGYIAYFESMAQISGDALEVVRALSCIVDHNLAPSLSRNFSSYFIDLFSTIMDDTLFVELVADELFFDTLIVLLKKTIPEYVSLFLQRLGCLLDFAEFDKYLQTLDQLEAVLVIKTLESIINVVVEPKLSLFQNKLTEINMQISETKRAVMKAQKAVFQPASSASPATSAYERTNNEKAHEKKGKPLSTVAVAEFENCIEFGVALARIDKTELQQTLLAINTIAFVTGFASKTHKQIQTAIRSYCGQIEAVIDSAGALFSNPEMKDDARDVVVKFFDMLAKKKIFQNPIELAAWIGDIKFLARLLTLIGKDRFIRCASNAITMAAQCNQFNAVEFLTTTGCNWSHPDASFGSALVDPLATAIFNAAKNPRDSGQMIRVLLAAPALNLEVHSELSVLLPKFAYPTRATPLGCLLIAKFLFGKNKISKTFQQMLSLGANIHAAVHPFAGPSYNIFDIAMTYFDELDPLRLELVQRRARPQIGKIPFWLCPLNDQIFNSSFRVSPKPVLKRFDKIREKLNEEKQRYIEMHQRFRDLLAQDCTQFDINALLSEYGYTVEASLFLPMAIVYQNSACATMLLDEFGCDINQYYPRLDFNDLSKAFVCFVPVVFLAVSFDLTGHMLTMLIKRGADLSAVTKFPYQKHGENSDLCTPAYQAILQNQPLNLVKLIEAGASCTKKQIDLALRELECDKTVTWYHDKGSIGKARYRQVVEQIANSTLTVEDGLPGTSDLARLAAVLADVREAWAVETLCRKSQRQQGSQSHSKGF